jgi:hypothetical protein
MPPADSRVPVSQACLTVKKSYNQLRRLLALGVVRGGFDAEIGYYIDAADVRSLTEGALSGPKDKSGHGGDRSPRHETRAEPRGP